MLKLSGLSRLVNKCGSELKIDGLFTGMQAYVAIVHADPNVVPDPGGFGSQIRVFSPSFCAQSAVDIPTMPAPMTTRSKSLPDVVIFYALAHRFSVSCGLSGMMTVS
jgi:hypothetical protein